MVKSLLSRLLLVTACALFAVAPVYAAGIATDFITGTAGIPVLTSCGTGSPTITGTDMAGTITMGTSATGCVATFATAKAVAPHCIVQWIATPLASQSYTTSTTAITITQTSTSGNVAKYFCVNQN